MTRESNFLIVHNGDNNKEQVGREADPLLSLSPAIRNLHIVTASVRTPEYGARALLSFSAFPLVFPAEKRIFVKTKQKRRTHEC